MKYLNNNKNQFILSFPDDWYISLNVLYKSELKRQFDIDKRIKIILITEDLNRTKFVEQQLKNNNIIYYKTSIEDLIDVILKIQTKYILLLFEGDFIITDNLNNNFIKLFEDKFNKLTNLKMLFAGQSINTPEINIENSDYLKNPGINKYLNSNIIFGNRIDVLKYFQIFKEIINQSLVSFSDEPLEYNAFIQLLNRFIFISSLIPVNCNKDLDYNNIDSNNDLFTTILEGEQDVIEKDGIRYINYNYVSNERLM